MVISHDRWFLDRIATHVLAFEGNSAVRWFEGNLVNMRPSFGKSLGVIINRLELNTKLLVVNFPDVYSPKDVNQFKFGFKASLSDLK